MHQFVYQSYTEVVKPVAFLASTERPTVETICFFSKKVLEKLHFSRLASCKRMEMILRLIIQLHFSFLVYVFEVQYDQIYQIDLIILEYYIQITLHFNIECFV